MELGPASRANEPDIPTGAHRYGTRKQDLIAGLALAFLVWLLYFTAHPVTESIDYVLFYKPNFHFLLTSLTQGELPLWNPYIGLGRPFLADLQNAVFYPPVYLMFFGENLGLFLLIWGHYCLAFFGMRAFAQALGSGRIQSLLAALAFVLAAPITTRLFVGHLLYVCGLCYAPLLFLFAVRLHSPGAGAVAAYAIVLALQFFTGHPQVFWFCLLGQFAFLLGRAGFDWRDTARILARFVMSGVWALCICAIVALPFTELVEQGNRVTAAKDLSAFGRFTARYLFGFFTFPPVPAGPGWEEQVFVGCLLFLPALVGLLGVRRHNVRGLLAVFLMGFLVSVNLPEPISNGLYQGLPGYSAFRLHGRSAWYLRCSSALPFGFTGW